MLIKVCGMNHSGYPYIPSYNKLLAIIVKVAWYRRANNSPCDLCKDQWMGEWMCGWLRSWMEGGIEEKRMLMSRLLGSPLNWVLTCYWDSSLSFPASYSWNCQTSQQELFLPALKYFQDLHGPHEEHAGSQLCLMQSAWVLLPHQTS